MRSSVVASCPAQESSWCSRRHSSLDGAQPRRELLSLLRAQDGSFNIGFEVANYFSAGLVRSAPASLATLCVVGSRRRVEHGVGDLELDSQKGDHRVVRGVGERSADRNGIVHSRVTDEGRMAVPAVGRSVHSERMNWTRRSLGRPPSASRSRAYATTRYLSTL